MPSISLINFEGQMHKIATVLTKISSYNETLYTARAKHDLQPLSKDRPTLSKPQDKPFEKRQTQANVSMSHLVDRKKHNTNTRKNSRLLF